MIKYSVLSLFSGIGGIDLGLERTGRFEVVALAEVDQFASSVLAKNWPTVPNIGDVTKAFYDVNPNGTTYIEDGNGDGYWLPPIDVIAGGFPCQDISTAWKGKGIDGKRSGLWSEFDRAISILRPAGVLVENVPALSSRGIDVVLADLASLGYDAEWDCIPAAAVGAQHHRERLFILAYPNSSRLGEQRRARSTETEQSPAERNGQVLPNRSTTTPSVEAKWPKPSIANWPPEPKVGRVSDGFPGRVARLRALGNAVVPQVAEHVGRILASKLDEAAHDQ